MIMHLVAGQRSLCSPLPFLGGRHLALQGLRAFLVVLVAGDAAAFLAPGDIAKAEHQAGAIHRALAILRRLAKNLVHGLLLVVREEVPVAPPHVFGLVSHPRVDKSLVDTLQGAVRAKAVA